MVKCKKCGVENKENAKFCEDCGSRLKHIKLPPNKLWIISVSLILLLIVIVFAIPLPYTAIEAYSEKVPYEAQESYTEKEPYIDQNCIQQEIRSKAWEQQNWGSGDYYYISIGVENTDTVTGTFFIECETTTGKKADSLRPSTTISPGGTSWLSCESNEPIRTWTEKGSKKEICNPKTEYKDVTKTRTVTKYQDKEKERTVTKYATLWQRLTGKVEYYKKV